MFSAITVKPEHSYVVFCSHFLSLPLNRNISDAQGINAESLLYKTFYAAR